MITNGLSGFLATVVAARVFDSDATGKAWSVFSAALFITYVTGFGLPMVVGRFARYDDAESDQLFVTALLLTTATSLAGALVFSWLAPDSVPAPLWSIGRHAGTAFFFFVVNGLSFATLLDVRLFALRRYKETLLRTAVVALIRIPPLLIEPKTGPGFWVFLWLGGVPALAAYLATAKHLLARSAFRFHPNISKHLRSMRGFALWNHLSVLALQAPQFVLPVVVAASVSHEDFANFYVAWGITTVLLALPNMASQVLLVEGGRDDDLTRQFRQAVVILAATMGALVVASLFASPFVKAIYGKAYDEAGGLLPLCIGGAALFAIAALCAARARVLINNAVLLSVTLTTAVVTLGYALARVPSTHTIAPAAIAWLLGTAAGAAVGLAYQPRHGSFEAHSSDVGV